MSDSSVPRSPIALNAAIVAQRSEAYNELRSAYSGAGAAEMVLLKLAANDVACVLVLEDCELAVAHKLKELLVTDTGNVPAVARALRDIACVTATIRSRVQLSLTAATTIMAQARLARLQRTAGDQ